MGVSPASSWEEGEAQHPFTWQNFQGNIPRVRWGPKEEPLGSVGKWKRVSCLFFPGRLGSGNWGSKGVGLMWAVNFFFSKLVRELGGSDYWSQLPGLWVAALRAEPATGRGLSLAHELPRSTNGQIDTFLAFYLSNYLWTMPMESPKDSRSCVSLHWMTWRFWNCSWASGPQNARERVQSAGESGWGPQTREDPGRVCRSPQVCKRFQPSWRQPWEEKENAGTKEGPVDGTHPASCRVFSFWDPPLGMRKITRCWSGKDPKVLCV